MDAHRKTGQETLIQITPLPQIVPSRVCLSCDVCCRFPEPDSFLRPYFTAEEIRRAVVAGIDAAHFPDPNGCQVKVVPQAGGEGYRCPAFDPATSYCRIYEVRPLDCQIYPLAVMWNPDQTQVMLGWDSKCPFLRTATEQEARDRGVAVVISGVPQQPNDTLSRYPDTPLPLGVQAYADKIAELVERDDSIETFAQHPSLIGRFQDDVVILRPLPRLTARLRARPETQRDVRTGGKEPRVWSQSSVLSPQSLTLADRPRFEAALASIDTPLASYAFAFHDIWRELLTYSWAEIEGHVCLFAQYADGLFMPLPPLGSKPLSPEGSGEGEGMRAFSKALEQAFAFMRTRNKGSAVTRLENVPEELKPICETLGYRVTPKDSDYLYRTRDLARLTGVRYRSQRAACNRFVREHRYDYGPYRDADRDACLALFEEWADQKARRGMDSVERQMLADSESAHRGALTRHEALGLVGRVVRVGERIRAYTFGYRRNPAVFCVLLEVTDRHLHGLAEFIFRESCREAVAQGYEFVNTMDDSGLPSLASSKQAYHPVRLVPSYIVSER